MPKPVTHDRLRRIVIDNTTPETAIGRLKNLLDWVPEKDLREFVAEDFPEALARELSEDA